MQNIKHIVGVPLLLAMIVALYFAYVVSLGFANEGCRFPRDRLEIWPILGDWATIHGLFFVGFLVPVATLVAMLNPVQLGGRSIGRIVTWLGLLAFSVSAIGSLAYLIGCQGPFARILSQLAPFLRGASAIAAAAFAIAILIGYVAGFAQSNQRAS